MEFLLQYEPHIRLGAFFLVLLLMAAWEFSRPRRPQALPRSKRWPANLGLVLVDSLTVRFVVPVLAVGTAFAAKENGWGLFNLVSMPGLLSFFLTILLLDLIVYFQHVISHKIPLLWRLHRVHHSDTEFDVTTALRFHPIEIVFSMILKLAAVVLLGANPAGVLAFEVVLNASAMFNHSNIRMPLRVDQMLRWFIVTPDMHRVHHSIHREETDSNYGFNLPWWDRLFGTYRAQPRDGHDNMTIGLPMLRDSRWTHLYWLIMQPFINTESSEHK